MSDFETPPGFEYLDDPTTISLEEYIPRIATTVYPDKPLQGAYGSIKLIRQRIIYAQKAKKNRLYLLKAPPPFPDGHIFAEQFFRWAKRTWRDRIPWIDPYYGMTPLTATCRIAWRNARTPASQPTYEQLQQEIQKLREENKDLKARFQQAEERAARAENKLKSIQSRAKAAYQKKKAADSMGGRPKSS